jgi:hypothetical protein
MARWRTHAFGLALESEFPLAGCEESRAPAGLPCVTLEIASLQDLTAIRAADAPLVTWQLGVAGERIPHFVGDPAAGFSVAAPGFGAFHVSGGADLIRCAPADVPAWRWQRYLIGQVLPFASALRGYEPWHASAVVSGKRAIVLSGASGSGKSTLAAELVALGAEMLADDVVALEPGDGHVRAHGGPGLMSWRPPPGEGRMEPGAPEVGSVIGVGEAGSLRVAVRRSASPVSVGAVFLLRRTPAGRPATIEMLSNPAPPTLLSNSFVLAPAQARRAMAQLTVCAEIARSVPVACITVPQDGDAHELAGRLLASTRLVA